ncbi:MAG: hypothetical protein H6671_07345 [Anaerolineaceae bacterium]|nr:hypothetical protein [Anaerolineae bacterium]MCB9455781.1 hypothetical protein [Anaerolineaceae bacterium]
MAMRSELVLAKELIDEKDYDKARNLLERLHDDPTAQKWLEKLDEIAPRHSIESTGNGNGKDEDVQPWQYIGLESKKSYGIQYRVNGEARPDWKDQPVYYALNELGREGWELISSETSNEITLYILKRAGAALNNQKVAVWDQ